MPVTDFECQIARGQIGRYLGGGMLSSEAMSGLEEHVAECAGCKALVVERRAVLLDSLGGEAPARALVELPVENPLIAALRAKAQTEAAPEASKPEPASKPAPRYAKPSPKGNLGKPLALAALLAVVLVGMSRLSHTATAPAARADASFAAETLPTAAPLAPKAEIVKPRVVRPSVQVKPKAKAKPVTARWHQVGTPNSDVAEAAPKRTFRNPEVPSGPVAPRRPQSRVDAKGARASSRIESGSKLPHSQGDPKPTPPANRFAARAQRHPSATSARRANLQPRKTRVAKAVRKHLRAHPRKATARTSVRVYGLDGRPLKP